MKNNRDVKICELAETKDPAAGILLSPPRKINLKSKSKSLILIF